MFQTRNLIARRLSFVISFIIAASAYSANEIRGVVTDEFQKPLAGALVRMSGLESYVDSRWRRVLNSGLPYEIVSDNEGRFSFRTDLGRRYDFSFDKFGHGPAFRSAVASDTTTLTVALSRGIPITGTVTCVKPNGERAPVDGVTVHLLLPSADYWYNQDATTVDGGKYMLRASLPPDPLRQWQVRFLEQQIQIAVLSAAPISGLDFVTTGAELSAGQTLAPRVPAER